MAHATADIGTGNYEVSLLAGHHSLKADEGFEADGKDLGPAPHELLCAALGACTVDVHLELQGKNRTVTRASRASLTGRSARDWRISLSVHPLR